MSMKSEGWYDEDDSDEIIPFAQLSISDAQGNYPVLWRTARLALPGLSDEQLAAVVSITVDHCPVCHESTRDCQCWNDE